MYDKDNIKESITTEQMFDLLTELGGEPRMKDNNIILRTICHNYPGEGSYKLYYYDNSKLFKCYTGCEEEGAFDIFQLISKVKKLNDNVEWSLYRCVCYIASYFGFVDYDKDFDDDLERQLADWKLIEGYEKNKELDYKKVVELKLYDEDLIKYLPQPRIEPWIEEGISYEIIKRRKIHYDPVSHAIVIPHYDYNGNLIGLRQRTLIKENEKYGKYIPARLNNVMYNHPLSFNLYNLNNSKENIKKIKTAVVFEGEKSCLSYASYFGAENDISVAVCGSSLISYQVQLLLSLDVQEIVIAFDKQFENIGDENFKKWTAKLQNIHDKYHSYCIISFLFDKFGFLDFKDAPIDKGPEIFLELYKRRIRL